LAGRLTIIGGGVMGLMTAYQAAPLADSVTVLDRSRVGDPATASFGWRGTGYKFAPWVGRVLAQLALQRGTVYDIGRFTPARFGVAEGVAS
jgi:glycine/D-amino acid oxidase-like deaminating enzyme